VGNRAREAARWGIEPEYKSLRHVTVSMYERIVVPTDGSEASMRAAREAFELAAESGGTVYAVGVVDESASSILLSGESMGPLIERLNQEARANVEGVATEAPDGVEVVTDVIRGTSVFRAIIGYTEEVEADVLVMGSTGRSGVGGILGSTTQRVTENTGIPVLVVSEPGDSATE
jgi:nucleotide-binding universal stress UspA family protein